jgi:hypothetical protein
VAKKIESQSSALDTCSLESNPVHCSIKDLIPKILFSGFYDALFSSFKSLKLEKTGFSIQSLKITKTENTVFVFPYAT